MTGSGSTLDTLETLVGAEGFGQVAITDGGRLQTYRLTFGQYSRAAHGTVEVSGVGSLLAVNVIDTYHGTGLLRITGGASAESESVLFSNDGGAGRGVIEVEDVGSSMSVSTRLMLNDPSSITVSEGAMLTTNAMEINAPSTVSIRGAGSRWVSQGRLDVRLGQVAIEQGGSLTAAGTNINGSGGSILVTGSASSFVGSSTLGGSSGSLALRHAGQASFAGNVDAPLSIDVGRGSQLTLISSAQLRSETIRFVADTSAVEGSVHTPIVAPNWAVLPRNLYAMGGTWNQTTRQFTVSSKVVSTIGTATDIDLSQQQRIQFNDADSRIAVGVSLSSKPTPSPVTVTVDKVAPDLLATLAPLVRGGGVVAAASAITITGAAYSSGEPFHLSFAVDPWLVRSETKVWRHNGSIWSGFVQPTDFVIADGLATFTATALGTYAIVSTLPGDFNDDGIVDATDYTVWHDTLGLTGASLPGEKLPADADGKRVINHYDLHIWRTNFGRAWLSANVQPPAVPEPSSLLATACIVLTLCGYRRSVCDRP